MVHSLGSFFIGCLCICIQTGATQNCDKDDFEVTTLNVTAVQISSYSNSTYTIDLNTTEHHSLGPESNVNITGLCPEVYYSFKLYNNDMSCTIVYKINETISKININRSNETAAIVSWEKVPGGSYSVVYRNSTYDLSGEININDQATYSVSATAIPVCPTVLYQFNVTLTVEVEQCSQFSVQTSYINNEDVIVGMVSSFSESSSINETAPVGSSFRLSVSIDWNAPDTINCPPIVYYKVTFGQFDYNVSLSTSLNITTGLLPSTLYSVVIVPVSIAGNGVILMRNITTIADIPWDSPHNFQIQPTSETAVRFTWSPPNIPGTPDLAGIKYLIEVTREDGTTTTSKFSHPTLIFNFGNLNRYERICATIAAVNDHGQGPMSSIICGHTAESRSDPARNLVYSVLTECSIAFSWDEPLNPYGIITHYKVNVNQPGQQQSFISNEKIIRINNLDLGLKYSLGVIPVNAVGDGEEKVISTYTNEDKITLFSNLTATKISDTLFQVSWTESNEANNVVVLGYELEYYPREIVPGNTSRQLFTIQSNLSYHIITGLDLFASYIITLTAVSNHGKQSSEIIYAALNYSTDNTESVLQLRIFGSIDCKEDNQTVVLLLLEGISKQVKKHCNCDDFYISHDVRTRLLCQRNADVNIIRIEVTQDAIRYTSTWLKSPNPIVFVNDKALLIDTSETCLYFISDINSEECVFRSPAKENCDTVITGTFFGTLISSCLITSLIWLIVVFLCWHSHTSNSESSSTEKKRRWTSSFKKRHKPASRPYENVAGFKTKNKLKLNTFPAGDLGNTTAVPTPHSNNDDDDDDDAYSNEMDIKELRENMKQQQSSTASLNPISNEYVNVRRKAPVKNSTEKTPASGKVAAPQVKPKPNVRKISDMQMTSNEAYKPSTRDECNKIIQGLQQK